MRAIERQNAEFSALDRLIREYNRTRATPVVDDDYPEVRFGYEQALRSFVDAMRANGRRL